MNNTENLSLLVQKWKDVEGVKPQNDPQFIECFLECLKDADYEDFTFDGDGAYFGKQVTWEVGSHYWCNKDVNLSFEIAYSDNEIRVYTGRNEGFWVSEYISINSKHEYFYTTKHILIQKLKEIFGIV